MNNKYYVVWTNGDCIINGRGRICNSYYLSHVNVKCVDRKTALLPKEEIKKGINGCQDVISIMTGFQLYDWINGQIEFVLNNGFIPDHEKKEMSTRYNELLNDLYGEDYDVWVMDYGAQRRKRDEEKREKFKIASSLVSTAIIATILILKRVLKK